MSGVDEFIADPSQTDRLLASPRERDIDIRTRIRRRAGDRTDRPDNTGRRQHQHRQDDKTTQDNADPRAPLMRGHSTMLRVHRFPCVLSLELACHERRRLRGQVGLFVACVRGQERPPS